MSADDAPVADLSIVADGDAIRVDPVEDHVVADVDVLADVDPPHPMKRHPPGRDGEVRGQTLQHPVLEKSESVDEFVILCVPDGLIECNLVSL